MYPFPSLVDWLKHCTLQTGKDVKAIEGSGRIGTKNVMGVQKKNEQTGGERDLEK